MMNRDLVCTQCGGAVRPTTGTGRMHEYRPGIVLPIPNGLPIPTCEECGETYLNDSEAGYLERRLKEAFVAYCQELIGVVRARAGVTLRELEKAAGVTPTYFSHVASGRKQPSLTLIRLLQAFAVNPEEVHRHLRGIGWKVPLREQEGRPVSTGAYVASSCFVSSSSRVAIRQIFEGGASYVDERSYSLSEATSLDPLPPQPSSLEAA